jgi:hypothetical protein
MDLIRLVTYNKLIKIPDWKEIIIKLVSKMNFLQDFPVEYMESCPVIDGKYKVLFKLGTGRFSK